jgi:Uncharacterized conserved protein
MSSIETVTIRRFKQLEDIPIALQDLTVLIGANNSGKSSVLQAIHFAVSIAQTAKLVGEGVAWANDTFQLSFNPSQLIYSPVADVMSLANGGTLQEPRASRIEIEFSGQGGTHCTVGLRRGRNRNIAVSIEGRQLGERLMDLESPFTVYAPGLAGVSKEERFLSAGVVRRIVARGDANLVLRNVLRMLSSDAVAWASFVEDMQSIFPGISISIAFDENTDENIQAFFQMPGGPRLPVDAAGTSILQASQILAYISLFRPSVLILDEPDSHLHPDNQRALCDLVFRLAPQRNFQALISTHSRHVLDAMRNRSSVIWLSRGRQVTEPDLSMTAMLLELGALDSVDYFADGEVRCVVATEDTHKAPLRALLWSNGFNDEDTEVASYTGCSKIDSAKVLGGFLQEKAPHVRLIVHRDRDYMSDAKAVRFENDLTGVGVGAFLTAPSDVEGYFVNAAHLSHANPAVSVERAQEIIAQATTETREKSIEALVNLRTDEAFQTRRNGGNPPNHGEIALSALTDYDADPTRWCRGKIVLGRVTALLQQEIGANPRIFVPSPHLHCPSLAAQAAAIWPPVA